MKTINFLSVCQALVNRVKDLFDCDEKEPNEEEVEIAELLLDKLSEVVHDFVFVEEYDHFNGTF